MSNSAPKKARIHSCCLFTPDKMLARSLRATVRHLRPSSAPQLAPRFQVSQLSDCLDLEEAMAMLHSVNLDCCLPRVTEQPQAAGFSSYPDHEIVGLPALSPVSWSHHPLRSSSGRSILSPIVLCLADNGGGHYWVVECSGRRQVIRF